MASSSGTLWESYTLQNSTSEENLQQLGSFTLLNSASEENFQGWGLYTLLNSISEDNLQQSGSYILQIPALEENLQRSEPYTLQNLAYSASDENLQRSGSYTLQNSTSEEDLQRLMDQRKRKRMISNKESARRSRMRKQKHLDDLMAQLTNLKKENNQILTTMNVTTQHYLNVEAENSILKVQIVELSQRLESLKDIINFLNTNSYNESTNYDGVVMNASWN